MSESAPKPLDRKSLPVEPGWLQRVWKQLIALLPDDVRGVILLSLFIALVVGIAVILLPTLFCSGSVCASQVASTASIWAIACLGSGFFAGFLFAIPKVLQETGRRDDANPRAASEASYRQQVNTNLEQISDWLTKIIVGVGLIELRNIPDAIDRLAAALARDLNFTHAYAGGLIVYFAVLGFLAGYLITRLHFAKQFRLADQEASGDLDEKLRKAEETSGAINEELRKATEATLKAQEVSLEAEANAKAAEEKLEINEAIMAGKMAVLLDNKSSKEIDSAIKKLIAVRSRQPDHRRATIILGTLYRKKQNWDAALEVLRSALDAKQQRGTRGDADAADMLYNVACYYCLMSAEAAEPNKTQFKQLMYDSLKQSLKIRPENGSDARLDMDFRTVHNEPEFQLLTSVASPPQPAAAPKS